ncbi:MAG: DoxX family membrane protein [Rubricella sp.]
MTADTQIPPHRFPPLAAWNALCARLDAAAPAILTTLARFAFAAVLLAFFWNSAGTKLDGLFTPTLGAYAQIFPRALEAASYDLSSFGTVHHAIILLGAWAEYILPALILLGLFTRLAALGMIGFVLVMTIVDIAGHGAGIGTWFDRDAASLIADQRLLWLVLLMTLVLRGAGPLSLDRIIGLR